MMIKKMGLRLFGKCWKTDLAREIGVSATYVYLMATGRRPMTMEMWRRIRELAMDKREQMDAIVKIIDKIEQKAEGRKRGA